jgi:peptidoglycan/LPS O-acetylase OafA/YrhL
MTSTDTRTPADISTARKFRPEIQALRAVAIIAVLIYHLHPQSLEGGFIGVDVFFVISGYLITAHLVRDMARGTRTPFGFWARRVRRLMPASLTVLAVTAVATMLVVPQQLWQQFLREIIAATFYVQNWYLASESVDYLSASAPPSPVQHFWTLSVEEQFYLVWPLVIIVAWWLAARSARHPHSGERSPGAVARIALMAAGVVWLVSFAYAWFATVTDPSPSFFATTTRAWEFVSGALLAAAAARSGRDHLTWVPSRWTMPARLGATWLGWALIATALVTFNAGTLHPGPPTLVPVVGTLLVIAGGHQRGRLSLGALASWSPIQYVGNISYSLYLWHWPLIVLVPYALGHPLGTRSAVGIIALSLALAALSYRWIERPMLERTPRPFVSTRGTMLGLAAAMAVVVAIPLVGLAAQSQMSMTDRDQLAASDAQPDPCRGAVAVVDLNGCADDAPSTIVPAASVASEDIDPLAKDYVCESPPRTSPELWTCDVRDGEGLRVALVGDSHAHQLIPTVQALGDLYDWDVTEAYKASCPFSGAERILKPDSHRVACAGWNQNVRDWLATEHFDLVITSQLQERKFIATQGRSPRVTAEDGLVDAWTFVNDTGARVLAVKDNPRPIDNPLECLELATEPIDSACTLPLSKGLRWDPQVKAAAQFDPSTVFLVDLDDAYCWDGRCHAVAGGTVVYRDRDGHTTATWARSLSPLIANRVPPEFLSAAGTGSF